MRFATVLLGVCVLAAPARADSVFSNDTVISIGPGTGPGGGQGRPYPSRIGVTKVLAVTISNVVVTLNGITHPRVSDLDIVLVGPDGKVCELVSDAGTDSAVAGIDLTFSRTGRVLSETETLATGTYQTVNFGGTPETFPNPGPGLVSNTDLAIFNSTQSNGTWSLFVLDDTTGPGSITGMINGWTIRFNDPVVEAVQSGSEFSYQGMLKKDGAPFSGAADLRFSIWNDASSTGPGARYGQVIERLGVQVNQGVFTALLDFGTGVFGEKQRFLQVESRVSPETEYTAVLPRAQVTGVPFAGVTPPALARQLETGSGSGAEAMEAFKQRQARIEAELAQRERENRELSERLEKLEHSARKQNP